MFRGMVVGAALLSASLAGEANAENQRSHLDPFMNPPPSETIYATNGHLGFSWRTTFIGWLGGVPIVREGDVQSAQRDKWWGESVRQLSPEVLRGAQR